MSSHPSSLVPLEPRHSGPHTQKDVRLELYNYSKHSRVFHSLCLNIKPISHKCLHIRLQIVKLDLCKTLCKRAMWLRSATDVNQNHCCLHKTSLWSCRLISSICSCQMIFDVTSRVTTREAQWVHAASRSRSGTPAYTIVWAFQVPMNYLSQTGTIRGETLPEQDKDSIWAWTKQLPEHSINITCVLYAIRVHVLFFSLVL